MAFPSESVRPRVLVTGLSGFTGQHVAAELREAGYEVVGLSSGGDAQAAAPLDLLDADGVHAVVAALRPAAVIHLAAIAFVAHDNVEAIYRTNIVGTRNLLAAVAALPTPPPRIILASSANVYGNTPCNSHGLNESATLAPANDYAVSKLAMEYMAHTWRERLPITVARPFNYTGVGQPEHFLIPKIVAHFRHGARAIELGNLDVWREFMDVRTVARVYRRLLETRSDVDTVNICAGVGYSLREVLAMMAEVAGYAIEVNVNPDFVRANEVRRLVGDPTRLLQRVGEVPAPTLIETLRWMYGGGVN